MEISKTLEELFKPYNEAMIKYVNDQRAYYKDHGVFSNTLHESLGDLFKNLLNAKIHINVNTHNPNYTEADNFIIESLTSNNFITDIVMKGIKYNKMVNKKYTDYMVYNDAENTDIDSVRIREEIQQIGGGDVEDEDYVDDEF